jgi:hypothetical protein
MKRYILPLIILATFVLLGIAVAWDCVRLAGAARERVQMADGELQKHEQRLAKLLADSPQPSPEVAAAVAAYQKASDPAARRTAYDGLVTSFRQTMAGKVDSTNPLDRKFMDNTAGAINRREIAEPPYDAELAAYRAYLDSWRGRVARWFSWSAKSDWQAM